jgi:acid phosphatase
MKTCEYGKQWLIAAGSTKRKAIEDKGYKIIANMGDQQSDLDGGFAAKAFRAPNPFYHIP